MVKFPFWLDALLTIGWFLLFVNALNWFDGINAQASMLAALGFFSIAILTKFVVLPEYMEVIKPQELQTLQMVVDMAILFGILATVYAFVEIRRWGVLRDA